MRAQWWLAGCVIGLLLASCGPAAPPKQSETGSGPAPAAAAPPALQTLEVAYVAPAETMAIPWIAKESGIFAQHGFDVNLHLVPGTPRLVQSIIAGDFDYAQVGAPAVLRARVTEGDTVILANVGDYFTFKIMAHPQSGVRSIADLRGRTVGVSQIGSTSHTFLKVLLSREGIPLDEVNVLQSGSNPQAATAMLTGNIDAAAVSGVMVPASERAGAVVLADGRKLKILAPGAALATTRRRIDRDRDATQRFMQAYVEGIHYYKTQRDATIAIMQQYMSGLAFDETAYLYDEVLEDYQPLPYPNDAAIQTALDRDLDVPVGDLKPADFYDVSFLRQLEQSGFVERLYR